MENICSSWMNSRRRAHQTNSRDDRRWQRERSVQRRCELLRRIGGEDYVQVWTRGEPGRMAKGKIHCSCPACRTKSWEIPSAQLMRQRDAGRQQLAELGA